MSNPTHLGHARRTAIALAVCCALALVAVSAAQAQVGLGTATPFVVLGGSSVTNTGPSVLNGDLGVSPGTSLVGFGLPATVNGATHANDAVAAQAQLDLTTAYDVAAGEPVAPADDLTGQDLGGLVLTSGAYRYASSAQLTGALTLNAEGDPNAQFVFEIGSTLTTASASSVVLVNGASPCNVYWQVGSSATLGTTTAFQGNLMALADISLNNGASVIGRVLARTGGVTLINNVIDGSLCGAGTTPTPTPDTTPGPGTTGGTSLAGSGGTPAAAATPAQLRAQARARARARARATRQGTATISRTPRGSCTDGFVARVRGRLIERAVFSLDGRRIASRRNSPFRVLIPATPGAHRVRARVTFRDSTRAKTVTLRYRACASALLEPRRGPSRFTG
ncbi:MAG TPA: ice-binding family protein [Thermoleophilaceae bacterium]|nr:ice-binding family protein [Thermoleophilaceae bacterium]